MIPRISATVTIAKASLQVIFDNLRTSGYTLIGPVVRDGAIVLDEVTRTHELPVGITDMQYPSRYKLHDSEERDIFGFTVGPHSWKRFLYPPRQRLFSAERGDGNFTASPSPADEKKLALIGVRSCDLSAIGILDRIFTGGPWVDSSYRRRREECFVLAVNCARAGEHCFCTSMGTGPRATSGFDLALTELRDAFVLEVGSEAGSDSLRNSGWSSTTAFDLGRARNSTAQAERNVRRELRTDDLPRLLLDNIDHPHWKDVAARCLGCGNCTMVCPTCFCSTVEDKLDLDTRSTERVRVWDSCYTSDFSHVHGGNIRPTTKARHRQWLTHKYGSFKEQFGVLGCVGCGRCLTWCPVGIDVTEEINALRTTRV